MNVIVGTTDKIVIVSKKCIHGCDFERCFLVSPILLSLIPRMEFVMR